MNGRFLKRLLPLAFALIFTTGSEIALAQHNEFHIPLIFSVEDDIPVKACLKVNATDYGPEGVPWAAFHEASHAAIGKPLTDVIDAMTARDRERLKALSHEEKGRDEKQFRQQADAFFSQFENIKPVAVMKYEMAGEFLMFYVRASMGDKTDVLNFSFALQSNARYGFLPYGAEDPVFRILKDWARNKEKLHGTADACADVPSATHIAPLRPWLYLSGMAAKDVSQKNQTYYSLMQKINLQKEILTAGRTEEYFDTYTAKGEKWLRRWHEGAQDSEREIYWNEILAFQPVYIFNADPLFVVYGRTGAGAIEARYYLRTSEDEFLQTKTSIGSTADSLFKSELFLDEAGGSNPFHSWLMAGVP